MNEDPLELLDAMKRGEAPTPPPLVRPEPEPKSSATEAVDFIVSITFTSRKDRPQPHVVSLGFDGLLHCTCQASYPCWAKKAFAAITNRATP